MTHGRPDPGAPSATGHLLAGVDVGGTKVATLVVDRDGEVLGRAVRSMVRRGPEASVEPIMAAIRAALQAADAAPHDLAAIGVGVPGRVDREAGRVTVAANLGWADLALASLVEDEIGVPCRIENDVRLAADGLIDHEVAGGARSLAYVAVGTGIGAGLVLGGALHRGERGTAGEIGHIIVEPDGVRCSCGQRGCLETVASGPAVLRQLEASLADGTSSTLRGTEPRTAKHVYDAARAGDPAACAVVDRAGRALARAIVGLVLTCDLERVLLGGGVAGAGAVFLDPIIAEIDRLRGESPLVGQLVRADTVRLLPAQFDAVAWGGIAVARRIAGMPPTTTTGGQIEPGLTGFGIDQRNGHSERMEEVVARDSDS